MAKSNTIGHSFYCMNCGREGIPLSRRAGREKERFHRKRLYCPWCHQECNHIEVRNDAEKQEFLELFIKGEFQEEVKASIAMCEEEKALWLKSYS